MKDVKYWIEQKKNALIARRVAMDAINQADEHLEQFYLKEFEGYVGKCFKVPNGDSSESWFTYYKVRKIIAAYPNEGENRNAYVTALRFDVRSEYTHISEDSAYLSIICDHPVSEKEFEREYKKVLARLTP